MGERKFFWLKLKEDFFKRHDIRIIESMDNGKEYVLFYLKLLLESISHEGKLRFSDTIPYNEKMLSTITDTNVDIVRSALKVLKELNLIEIYDDQTLYMSEINKMIGSENSSAERVRKFRERNKTSQCDALVTKCDDNLSQSDEKALQCNASPLQCNNETLHCNTDLLQSNTSSLHCNIEIEKEIDTEKELELEQDKPAAVAASSENCPFSEIQLLWNEICVSYDKLQGIEGARKKAVGDRWKHYKSLDTFRELFEKAEASDFLKNASNRGWKADFDWLMKAENFEKALGGRYDNDRPPQNRGGLSRAGSNPSDYEETANNPDYIGL